MEKINVHRFGFFVTNRCTLRCRLCCAYAPYFENEKAPHYSLSESKEDIDRLFQLVDYVDIFSVAGGEPFLHKDLAELLNHFGLYREKIGRIHLLTNGTIELNKGLAEAILSNRVRLTIDDYGKKLSTKVKQIEEMCQTMKIDFEHRSNTNEEEGGAHCKGWVNLLDVSDTPCSSDDSKRKFSSCIQANELRCNPVMGGKIFACPYYEYLVRIGKIELEEPYFLNLRDKDTISTKRKKMISFLNIKNLPSCAYCNGWFQNSKRYTPAEQIGEHHER